MKTQTQPLPVLTEPKQATTSGHQYDISDFLKEFLEKSKVKILNICPHSASRGRFVMKSSKTRTEKVNLCGDERQAYIEYYKNKHTHPVVYRVELSQSTIEEIPEQQLQSLVSSIRGLRKYRVIISKNGDRTVKIISRSSVLSLTDVKELVFVVELSNYSNMEILPTKRRGFSRVQINFFQ